MSKYFGTDGVRGVANRELTPELAFQLGRAGAYVLTKKSQRAPKVLLGKDGRKSGDMLEAALGAGLCSIGAEVHNAGLVPTPAVAYLVRKYGMDAGIMITASHNPMQDNGIKFFDKDGFKLSDSTEDEIESHINMKGSDSLPRPEGAEVGIIKRCAYSVDDYTTSLLYTVPELTLSGMKIALDCANGATSIVAPRVFERLGADVHTIFNRPSGSNINANCGSTHMEALQAYVKTQNVDIGIAFDGDGDRMLAIDENGNVIDGDAILAICGLDLLQRGQLPKNTIVATSMSNQGLDFFCREHGINLIRTDVGDRYVLQKMLEDELILGGEQSGHYIFRQFTTSGDGILSALQLVSAMNRKNETLSNLAATMETFPQVLVNKTIPNNRKAEIFTNPKIKEAQAEIESRLANNGRLLLRHSGTEPLVRVMLEGRNKEEITKWANELAGVIENELA